jgi:hypothetical protein
MITAARTSTRRSGALCSREHEHQQRDVREVLDEMVAGVLDAPQRRHWLSIRMGSGFMRRIILVV